LPRRRLSIPNHYGNFWTFRPFSPAALNCQCPVSPFCSTGGALCATILVSATLPVHEEVAPMPDPPIKIIPTPYEDVLKLLHSDALRTVEQAIASAVRVSIVEDYSNICTNLTRGDMSVSGLTVAEIESLLVSRRSEIIAFGVRFLRDQEATHDDEEHPEGEEREPPESTAVEGLGTGFGIKYAIYYNFLANRTPTQLRAYLKNRRIPHQARFAKELRRLFDQATG
jgi:hypothetical protein